MKSIALVLALIGEVIRCRHAYTDWQQATQIECECKRCRVRQRFNIDNDSRRFVTDHGSHGSLTITLIDRAGRGLVQWGSFS